MLSGKFAQLLNISPGIYNTAQYPCLFNTRLYSRKCSWWNTWYNKYCHCHRFNRMSTAYKFRFILKDFSVSRLLSGWTRNFIVNRVVKRCKSDRSVRDLLLCFRSTLTPRRTLLLYGTAACRGHDEDRIPTCSTSITDEDLQDLLLEIEDVDELAKRTLYCEGCERRVVIDNKQPGIRYCTCKDGQPPENSADGWIPYMETDDVIIWRKQYKGPGLYAYKVYGRYKEIYASDYAAVQVDGAYRRAWDTAVAALSIIERQANGISNQTVLHWEVLWPRLFANRDYVYIRRHKEFNIQTKCQIHKEGLFEWNPCIDEEERESVHSHAKWKGMEIEAAEASKKEVLKDNKVYVIVSKSCEHRDVPVTKNAIRVTEYWSHMVIRTTDGDDKPGMEFVLTYYDEPAVGGMPSGITAWATGRAAPAYLATMRNAANNYSDWLEAQEDQDFADFEPFSTDKLSNEEVSDEIRELDMKSSLEGPDMESVVDKTRDQSTQTDGAEIQPEEKYLLIQPKREIEKEDHRTKEEEADTNAEEDESSTSWWRYLFPLYYFV